MLFVVYFTYISRRLYLQWRRLLFKFLLLTSFLQFYDLLINKKKLIIDTFCFMFICIIHTAWKLGKTYFFHILFHFGITRNISGVTVWKWTTANGNWWFRLDFLIYEDLANIYFSPLAELYSYITVIIRKQWNKRHL